MKLPWSRARAAAITSRHQATVKRFGEFDLLVSNSGGPPAGTLISFNDATWRRKIDADENYLAQAKRVLSDDTRAAGIRAAFAMHDRNLIRRIADHAESMKLGKDSFEFQMLYGIQREEQFRLAHEGLKSIVLIAYRTFWFPWFMRRLAERPANALFVLRNVFAT